MILIAGAIVQSTVLPYFTVWGLKIELVLLLVAAWSMLRGFEEGIVWAIVGGMALDLFSAAPFGAMTLALAMLSYILGHLGRDLVRINPLLPIAVAPVVTVLFNAVVAITLEAFGWQVTWKELFAQVVVPLCVVNTAAMVPVYWLLYRAHSRMQWEIDW